MPQNFSEEDKKLFKKDAERCLKEKNTEYLRLVNCIASLNATMPELIKLAAYFCLTRTERYGALIRALRKLERLGCNQEEIDSLFTTDGLSCEEKEVIKNLDDAHAKLVEQALKVKRGFTKPAYKSRVIPELVKELYAKLGTQQAVADELGISVKTVRNRLRS